MTQRQLQQLILLGVGGFAIYYLFFRKQSPVMLPFPTTVSVTPSLIQPPASVLVTPQVTGVGTQIPASVNITPQLVGTMAPALASIIKGVWQPGPGGFPPTPDDSGAATDPTQYDYVLTE